ncbi:hypothetical protein D9757_002714 [Collybiopsis confluens]|uniref:Rrn7/TAF1B C-terminal cyclin domain-containing protein n=1 Tax=Collybiopsis confluens TaxID=2823264 RepID=A0A8H5HWB7_9AGAR|nr:hypothetical protein D9757_002714 [Collybiopsis confluens]
MFKSVWKPVISAIAYAFISFDDDYIIQRAIAGFRQCATLARHFHLPDIFDFVVVSLSQATTLLPESLQIRVPNYPTVEVEGQSVTVSNLSVKFGINFKGQLAAVVLFNIVNVNGNALREGWTQIFEMFQNLFTHSLLRTGIGKASGAATFRSTHLQDIKNQRERCGAQDHSASPTEVKNYRNETNEAEDVGNHMMKKRTVKANKKKKERKSKADPKLYHGSNGRYLYFQCQQLILRKQVAFLAKLWDLPQEFEMVCRDLWALHLSLLPDPPPSEPYFDNASTPNDLSKVEGENPGKRHSRSPSPETQPTGPNISDSVSSTPSDDNSDSEERDQDPELAEFMRENSESDGDDNDDDDVGEIGDDKDSYEGKGQARGRRGHNMYEKPTNNLAVLIVALWTLRIPVILVESYKLPYLDPVRLLPLQMVSHLTKYNIQALSPAHAPKTLTLHTLTSRLAMQLYNSYMILTPEGNAAPLLWRVTQGMGGTPTLYALTKRLSHRLSLPLALHKSLVPKLLQIESREAQTRRYDNAPVEGSLLAAVIVVLKMVYGLDGENRSPRDSDDPAFALPCLDDYLGRVGDLHDADPRREAVFNSEKPIFMDSLNDDILDEYLAFCERIALRPSDNTSQGL